MMHERLGGELSSVHTLESARVRAGLTKGEAAELLGVSVPTLSRYEEDAGRLPVSTMLAAADLYAVPLAELWAAPAAELVARIRPATKEVGR